MYLTQTPQTLLRLIEGLRRLPVAAPEYSVAWGEEEQ